MPRIYLVDASPYIFRAYFSIPKSVTTPEGRPINAAKGFGGFLLKLIEGDGVDHMALTFDRSLNTSFRNEFYPEYKAQRDLPPEKLVAQLGDCERLGKALGIATFAHDSYEADDLIGSLCQSLLAEADVAGTPEDLEIVIVTSDKDLAQLVSPRVQLYDFAKDERYGPSEVKGKFGVAPEQIIDYLALAGDSVDNIPGAPGIGAKTASALLDHFADLEELYGNLDQISDLKIRGAKSLAAKLEEHRAKVDLSRRLATVVTDFDMGVGQADLKLGGLDQELLAPLIDELGFGRFAERAEKIFSSR